MQQDETLRERAIIRLRKRREFFGHLLAYLFVNAALVVFWATFAHAGLFWPIFPLVGWGIGVFFHGWDVFFAEPSEDAIQKQMRRMS